MTEEATATIEQEAPDLTDAVTEEMPGSETEQTEAQQETDKPDKGLESFKKMYERHDKIERGVDPDAVPEKEAQPEASEGQPDFSQVLTELDVMDVPGDRKQAFRNDPMGMAESAVKRDAGKNGIPDDLLENWKYNDPEGFVAYGLKRMGVQAHQDQLLGRAQAEGPPQAQPPQENAEDAQPADATEQPQELDWDALVKPIAENFATEYGEDVAKGIAEPLKMFGQAIHANSTAQIGQRDQVINSLYATLNAMNGERVNARIELLRERFGETDYPQLTDDDSFKKVCDRYDVLAKGGNFQTVDDAFRVACAMELDAQRREDIKRELLQKEKQRRKSRPSARPAGDSTRKMTPEQRGIEKLKEMASDHDMDLR